MPYVRGIRDYSFYNDEEVDYDMRVEQVEAIRLNRVPAYKPATTLAAVTEALRNLERGEKEDPGQFVTEDDMPLSDMSVVVAGVGLLQFPLTEDIIDKLMDVKANSSDELVVSEPQHCHVIPKTELTVEFNEEVLERIKKVSIDSLNMDGKCSLKPNIHSMSIYGPGQYCGPHRDTERDKALIVEFILPTHCRGGDLYIKHGTETHKCSSAGGSDTVRWTACYSDCARGVFEVEEGHRVVLSFDVDLEYLGEPEPWVCNDVDLSLDQAVTQHFCHEDRLVVLLLHRYSENTPLDWHKIKGRDSTYARALHSVAESQDLRVFLALAKCLETWESSGYHGPVRTGGSVEVHCRTDECGHKDEEIVSIDYQRMAREVSVFGEDLWCLSEPDKEVKLGWYGEGPAVREQWYHRACVVLIKKKYQNDAA